MKKNLFQSFLILVSIFISSNVVRSEEELRMSASEKAWSVFYPNDKKNCFIVSQSIKDEAFRNGEKLSSVNRDRGKLFVQKNPSSPAGFVASFSAGYPLKIGGKFVLKVDGTKNCVFGFTKPKTLKKKIGPGHRFTMTKNLIEYLKVGNKAIMEAESHRGTITKDTLNWQDLPKLLKDFKKFVSK